MKITCTILLCFVLFSCQQTAGKKSDVRAVAGFDEVAETAAILQVIENETNCFFAGNYECWAKNWSHESYSMQAWNNDDGSMDAAIGWEKINEQGKNWIEKYYKNGKVVIHPVVKKEKPLVKFFSERTAYLIWKQYNADRENKYYKLSQETRIMEKADDGWKIVNVSAFWNSNRKIPVDSLKPE